MRLILKIYNIIREEIMLGKLNPGERLVEKDLYERLNTTRAYMREALKLLANDGLVELNPGKGARVSRISYERVKNLHQIIAILEPGCVKLAMPNLRDSDIKILSRINNDLKKCIDTKDMSHAVEMWHKGNAKFHRLFVEKTQNEELLQLADNMRRRSFDFRYGYLYKPYYKLLINDHECLIEAIRNNNASQAKKVMENHLHKALNIVLKGLKNISL